MYIDLACTQYCRIFLYFGIVYDLEKKSAGFSLQDRATADDARRKAFSCGEWTSKIHGFPQCRYVSIFLLYFPRGCIFEMCQDN